MSLVPGGVISRDDDNCWKNFSGWLDKSREFFGYQNNVKVHGGKNILGGWEGGFDFYPHLIISSVEIHSILLWLTGMVVSVLPLMKLDLEKGVHLLSRSQLFKRWLAKSTLFIKCLGGGGYSTNVYVGRLCPEVQPLTLYIPLFM